MDLTSAIAAIQKSGMENAEEIASVLKTRFKELSEYENKNKKLESQLTTLLEIAGAEGEDLIGQLKSATEKVKAKDTELKQTIETLATEQAKLRVIERQSQIEKMASKFAANPNVAQAIILPHDELDVEKGTVNGQPFPDWAKNKPDFLAALFPSTQGQTNNLLPSGSPLPGTTSGGQTETQKKSIASEYILKNYPVPDYLKKNA